MAIKVDIPGWLTVKAQVDCYSVSSLQEAQDILYGLAEHFTDEDLLDGYGFDGLFVNEASREWMFIEIVGNGLRETLADGTVASVEAWLTEQIESIRWGQNDGNADVMVGEGECITPDMGVPQVFLDLDPDAHIRPVGVGKWEAVVFGVPFSLGRTVEDLRMQISKDGLVERMEAVKLNRGLGLPDDALTGLWWALGHTPDGDTFGEAEARAAAEKIRHRHLATDYDDLLASGMSREAAREECQPRLVTPVRAEDNAGPSPTEPSEASSIREPRSR